MTVLVHLSVPAQENFAISEETPLTDQTVHIEHIELCIGKLGKNPHHFHIIHTKRLKKLSTIWLVKFMFSYHWLWIKEKSEV